MNSPACDAPNGVNMPLSLEKFGLSQCDLEQLLREMSRADATGRLAIRSAIRNLGPAAAAALGRALLNVDPTVRQAAAKLLRDLPDAHPAAPQLAQAATDEDWLVRFWSIDALGRIPSAARGATSAFERALHDPMPLVRNVAFLALARVNNRC